LLEVNVRVMVSTSWWIDKSVSLHSTCWAHATNCCRSERLRV